MSKWTAIEHLTSYLERPQQGDSKHPTLWPSEATAIKVNDFGEEEVVGKCRRATFFRFAKNNVQFYPQYSYLKDLIAEVDQLSIPTDRYMRWIWEHGRIYEEYVKTMSAKSGIFINEEIPIYIKDFNVSGKIDIVVINPRTGKYSIVEVKSIYGHNANSVIGPPNAHRTKTMGQPRDSNLMQIGIYEWWYASHDDTYENSRLLYGARDTGRFAEFSVSIQKQDGLNWICYEGIVPYETPVINSGISIDSILYNYQLIQNSLDAGEIPARDFTIEYSQERITELYSQNRLSKTDTAQYEKIVAREAENIERVANGKKPKVDLKPITKGDWQCKYCKFKNYCYNSDNTVRA